jgi:hypothetical protein
MGYGYLGAYLAFGMQIYEDDAKTLWDAIREVNETLGAEVGDMWEAEASLYQDEKFPNIHVKQFGTDEETMLFVCWGKCYQGGGFWNPLGSESKHTQHLPLPSAQILVAHEQTFDAEVWGQFCKKYKLKVEPPKWQTLICFGQGIY